MYAFMYVDTETMAEEEYFPSTKHLFQTTKMSALGPIPKKLPGFSYIRLEDYELDINFDGAETKIKSD